MVICRIRCAERTSFLRQVVIRPRTTQKDSIEPEKNFRCKKSIKKAFFYASSMRTTCSRSTGAILKDVKDVINHRARHCIVQLVHTDRQRYTSVQIEQL